MDQVIRSPKQLGALIHQARVQRNMSQKGLAELIGTYQKTISSVENGSSGTKIDTIFSLLAALHLDLELVPRRKGGVSLDNIF